MAQDYECFPRQQYNEGFITGNDLDYTKETKSTKTYKINLI